MYVSVAPTIYIIVDRCVCKFAKEFKDLIKQARKELEQGIQEIVII